MKETLICTILLALALTSFGQQVKTKDPLTSQEYLERSKVQKTNAFVFLGVGTVSLGIGLSYFLKKDYNVDEYGLPALVLTSCGALLDLISIPIFISASKNKRLGLEASTSLRIENGSPGLVNTQVYNALPAVSVKVTF